MKIQRYSDHMESLEMAEDFLNTIGSETINESDETSYKTVLHKIVKDLKLNTSLVLTFGTGITALIPLVNKLIANTSLKIEITPETIVLMTITGLTIAYLEEQKEGPKKDRLEKDAKSMLEELKLKGVGNGVVKKLVKCIKSMGNIFEILFKNKRHIVDGFFNMFAYAAISVPLINALLYMVSKYNMDLDSLPGNFLSLGLGVTTLAAKHGLNYIINLLKDKLNLDKIDILKNVNDVDDPMLKNLPHPEYIDTEYDGESSKLIKEQ